MTVRGDILNEASRLINGPKQDDYGPPAVLFGNIAVGWQAILGCAVSAEQVARCMAWLKIARLNTGPHTDSYIDGAGYIALAAELSAAKVVTISQPTQQDYPHTWPVYKPNTCDGTSKP